MTLIGQLLYWLTMGLLVPVVALLLMALLQALLLAGANVSMGLERRRYAPELDRLLSAPSLDKEALQRLRLPVGAPLAPTISALLGLGADPKHAQRILSALEIDHETRISAARVLGRTGPMLGLMGTLIPLGPALLGLAEGDLQSLAENMLVAFATTVIGLLIGALGFFVQQSRQRWAAEDMARAEYIAAASAETET